MRRRRPWLPDGCSHPSRPSGERTTIRSGEQAAPCPFQALAKDMQLIYEQGFLSGAVHAIFTAFQPIIGKATGRLPSVRGGHRRSAGATRTASRASHAETPTRRTSSRRLPVPPAAWPDIGWSAQKGLAVNGHERRPERDRRQPFVHGQEPRAPTQAPHQQDPQPCKVWRDPA